MDLIQRVLSIKHNVNVLLVSSWIATGYFLWFRCETILGFIGMMALVQLLISFSFLVGMSKGIVLTRIKDENGFMKMSGEMQKHYQKIIKMTPMALNSKMQRHRKKVVEKINKEAKEMTRHMEEEPKAKA